MKFDLTQDDYRQFIEDLRNRAKDPKRTYRDLPVLPPPPEDPAHAEYIDIELTAEGVPTVTLRIRRHDLYLIGYRMDNGQWLEFSGADGRQLIPNSQFLGFGENYLDMGGLANLPEVGYRPLLNAINILATATDERSRKSALRLLAVMICESARFDQLLDIFAEQVLRSAETPFEIWMMYLIHSWGDLPGRLLRADSQAIDYFRLPRDSDGNDNILTRELGIMIAAGAAVFLVLLLGSYLPPGFCPCPSLHTNDDIRGKGQPLAEVFSVRIDDIDGEKPGELYGNIIVTDELGSFSLYNRARDKYESIYPNDIASLTGPYRSISLCRFFTISLNLIDRDADLSFDDEVSKGSFSWDIFYLSTTNYYGMRFLQQVTGRYGSASVFYTMFDDAVQAKVDVVLINGDGEDPADVYGSIVARYDNYEYFNDEQKKYYQTRLFNTPSDNLIVIRPGDRIPLSRDTVAVPTTSALVIDADLWDHDTFSRDDEIARCVAIFPLMVRLSMTLLDNMALSKSV